MALIPTIETFIFEIRKSFGLSNAEASKDKNKFQNIEKDITKHGELFEKLIDDLFKSLKITAFDSDALKHQFIATAELQHKLSQGIYSRMASKAQISWLLASHVIIPAVAKTMAIWQRDQIMDSGMPGNGFWYLPKEVDGALILPVAQVFDWLNSLVSKDKTDTYLLDQVYNDDNPNAKSTRLGIDRRTLEKDIKNWRTSISPAKTQKLVYDWFNDDLELEFNNTFEKIPNENCKTSIERASSYLNDNNISSLELSKDIQCYSESEIDNILRLKAKDNDLKYFLEKMYSRFSPPSNKTIRLRLHYAIAAQDMYMRFGKLLHSTSFKAFSTDYSDNYINQLILLFNTIYNKTWEIEENTNPNRSLLKNTLCDENLDKWLSKNMPYTLVCSVLKTEGDLAISNLLDWFNHLFLTDSSNALIPIFIKKSDMADIHPEYKAKQKEFNLHMRELCQLISNKKKIKKSISPYALMLIARDSSEPLDKRYKAVDELAKITYPNELWWTYYMESELMFLDDYQDQLGEFEYIDHLLLKVKESAFYTGNKAYYLFFQGRYNLLNNKIDVALDFFKKANKESRIINSGKIRGLSARYIFMINAVIKKNGYSLINQNPLYRDMMLFGGFPDANINGIRTPSINHAIGWHLSQYLASSFIITPTLQETETMLINMFEQLPINAKEASS